MGHHAQENFNPYKNYRLANMMLGVPLFFILLSAAYFLFPKLQGYVSDFGEMLGIMLAILGFPFLLVAVVLVLAVYCIPAYLVAYTAEKMNLQCDAQGRLEAARCSAFYYWIFSVPFILLLVPSDGGETLTFSGFVLPSLYAAAAGALSSVIPSAMLPAVKKRKG